MNLVMIGGFIANGWMTICTSLSYLVYNLVELLYRVFASISNVNLFSKSVFDKFTARMYSVVAILMLFILAYNLILMIINPDDKKGTGQTTKFVKEVVISLILIILLPLVFNYMAIFQKHILDSQIITKIVLGGSTGDANSDCDFSKYTSLDKLDSENISTATLKSKCEKYNDLTPSVQGAYIMNATMVGSFLYPINYNFNKCEDFIIKCDGTDLKNCDKDSNISDKKDRELCGKYFYNYKMTQYDGGIWHLLNNSYFKNMVKDEDQKILNFNYFLALVGGILAVIMFASYTIMIGIRVAKLGFLELISPIPVMMRMIPKQKEAFFDKWLKELKNTYLDVFIRLIIINFALFSISLVPDVIEQLSASGDDSLAVVLLAKFVVILGILQFAKETPDLIKEFFGGSGRFSIKKGFENWKTNPGVNAIRAGVYGASTADSIHGGIGSAISGMFRGGIQGYDKAVKGIDKIRTERANGSTFFGRSLDRARMAIGMETVADADERRANREVEGKWHITERMKRNAEAMENAKKIKSTVKDSLNKEDTKQTYNVDGVEGNLYQLHKYAEGLYQSISTASSPQSKERAYKKYQSFQQQLVETEKAAVNKVVTKALQAKTENDLKILRDDYNINGAAVGTIRDAANKIVTEASKGTLGALYDDNGRVREFDDQGNKVGWNEASLDSSDSLKELMNALGNESAQLASKSQKDFGVNYDKHVANRNVVKKEGSSEKK